LRASSSDCRDVGTPRTRRPALTRSPGVRMKASEARPEPRPTVSPSLMNSTARSKMVMACLPLPRRSVDQRSHADSIGSEPGRVCLGATRRPRHGGFWEGEAPAEPGWEGEAPAEPGWESEAPAEPAWEGEAPAEPGWEGEAPA